jgi:serine protease Do
MRIALALCLSFASALSAAPTVINDMELLSAIQRGIGEYAGAEDGPSADDLSASLKDAPSVYEGEIPPTPKLENPDEAVYLISSVYLCGKCDKWHLGGTASAWALTADGLMVTNHHVFAKAKGGAMGVCGADGKTHRIIEVVAADEANDIAIFRVDAKDLKPLPIGPDAKVGSSVEVVSHPERRFFTHTFGKVSRYHQLPGKADKPKRVMMSITADYAKGSSGGPVLDAEGRVIGMVASTQSIYYESSARDKLKGPLQMVVKNCVPVSAISAMLDAEAVPQ